MTLKEFLKQLPLFSDLTDPEIDQLVPVCRLVKGQAGSYIIREGEPVRTIYFLLSGEAVVMKGAAADKQTIIGSVVQGTIVGELSLYDNADASATIQATEPFTAVAISSAEFNRVMENNQVLGYKIFRKLARNTSRRLKIVSGELAEYIAVP
jgi:CRP/FNR family transcriptional regulator/CRP/FNR family cyclic AMP-dependent transcriptional regulator